MIRVLLVDDDPLVRAGLRIMLSGAEDLTVVGEAADGDQVSTAVTKHRPDVVLMDIRMPGVDGIAATETLRRHSRPPEVIVLTTFDADEQVLAALRAGASGFVLKDTPPADIVAAIRRVAAGDPILSPTVTRKLITRVTGSDRQRIARQALEKLTDRERDVAAELGRGRTNAEVAADLHMSTATVKAYVSRMLTKLDLNNRTQIALLAHDSQPDED